MEACRVSRLTRNQHVLLRLGELVAWTECAAAFARRSAAAADGGLPAKGDRRFDAPALAAMSRVFAREAALKVTIEGLRWVHGAAPAFDADLDRAVGLAAVLAAQGGLIEDMDAIADALYGRTA
jgi:alkylation response protein AidB-like acyl-CoA dehydrogenase